MIRSTTDRVARGEGATCATNTQLLRVTVRTTRWAAPPLTCISESAKSVTALRTLHNIQADSDGDGIVVGGESTGYGHVGRDNGPGDSDCWGCHGFDFNAASAPFTGPVIPTLYNTDIASVPAGKDTMVVLSGAAFTNTAGGKSYEADVRLTAANGTSVTLKPELVLDEGSMAVKIPAKTRPGNYRIQAVKGEMASNPSVITVTPDHAHHPSDLPRQRHDPRDRIRRVCRGVANLRDRNRHHRQRQASGDEGRARQDGFVE